MTLINYVETTTFEGPPDGLQKKTSLVVDGESLAYRAYYAFTRSDGYIRKTKEGYYSGGFWGFFTWLGKRYLTNFPHQMYVCWGDKRENLKRKELLASYKGHKPPEIPPAFLEQIRDIRLALNKMGFEQYWSPGYEGDDVIATVVKREEGRGYDKVIVISNDKDMLQLVNKTTSVVQIVAGNSREDTVYADPNQIIEKFGIPPTLLVDYLILLGDTSDNIAGVKGVGPKTAVKLLETYGKIENWIDRVDELEISGNIKKLLKEGKFRIDVNRKLITLNTEAPLIPIDIQNESITADELFNIYEVNQPRPHQFVFED